MGHDAKKKFTALDAEIQCECKTITDVVDYSMDMHNHDGYEVLLVLGGIVNLYTEYGGNRLKRGDLVCIDELDFHRVEVITKGIYDRIVVNVKRYVLEGASSGQTDLLTCFRRNSRSPLNVIHLSKEEMMRLDVYARSLQESLLRRQPGDEILSDAYLKQIMVTVNRHFLDQDILPRAQIMPGLVMETFNYIENHLTEEITLKCLEENLHYNGTYISRRFKRITGISLQNFIIAKKVMLSCKLLREGVSPCNACEMTGFNSYSNFSRTFSKQVGMSPKKYQMENR
ncbi:MAG: AraC family transcriptional regulator [Acetatifactor sp.]